MNKEKIQEFLKKIPKNTEVIAVVKTKTNKEIWEAIESGIKIIGDNYIQEAQLRTSEIKRKAKHHLIGHLQKNKVKKAVKIFDLIQTVDSLKIARLINKECEKINKTMPIMIQINIAKEKTKTGILPKDLEKFIEKILQLKNIKIVGLMCHPPIKKNSEKYFKKTKELFWKIKHKNKLNLKYLSMGTSQDYSKAIKQGSNMIRIGTLIFGKRN